MTDQNDPFDGVEPLEIKDIDVYAFRCGTCGSRAVPVDGYGTECPVADCDGELSERTTETYTITVSVEQFKQYAESVIAH